MDSSKMILILAPLFIVSAVSAQYFPPVGSLPTLVEPLTLISSPKSPSPNESFTVTASTPTIDKNTAFFSWTVNGIIRSDFSGYGKNYAILTAGNVGSQIKISVEIQTEKEILSDSLTVYASDLTIVWFAETYVPKWYKGKALPSANSFINITAIPNIVLGGKKLKQEEIIFTWSVDDEDDAFGGIGKQNLRIRAGDSITVSQKVRVSVEDVFKRIKKEKEIFIGKSRPLLIVYPFSPLGGIENRVSAKNFHSPAEILDFIAEPFFFNSDSFKNLEWEWSVAGTEIKRTAENQNLITIDAFLQREKNVPVNVNAKEQNEFSFPASYDFNAALTK